MSINPIIPNTSDSSQPGGAPPVISTPPATGFSQKSGSLEHLLAIVLSVYLLIFLADALISFADDSLLLFFGVGSLTIFRNLVAFSAIVMAILIYVLMALTPMVPKRLFVPLTLFNLIAMLASIPFLIYYYSHTQLIVWSLSACQLLLGLTVLFWLQGGLKFRWPLLTIHRLNLQHFSWKNLAGFVLANLLVLLPAIIIYLLFSTALAVDHFSEGFVALRPNGIMVQVRKYVRNDGKVIELFPMAHVADAGFYKKVSQTFPTNSLILMEGVADSQNLLTNRISYKRMAKSLGLAEQHEEFTAGQGEIVMADIDINQFSKETIGFLNLVMLVHAKGFNPSVLEQMTSYSPTPHFEKQLFDDLLNKRNEHLLGEIQSHLAESDHLMVPWGAAHMAGIARGISKLGFHVDETHEYMVIHFRGFGKAKVTR